MTEAQANKVSQKLIEEEVRALVAKYKQSMPPVPEVTDWDRYKALKEDNDLKIITQGFDARLNKFQLAGDAKRVKQLLDEIRIHFCGKSPGQFVSNGVHGGRNN